ncbi:MAG: AzlD domain-containing protein [Clostridia bacterium]|nr:AzlD domain-containing protein [Clostridia bacterium]
MNDINTAILIASISLTTIALRFLPFVVFGSKGKPPKFIAYLGDVLTPAVIGMLVVYCLREMNFIASPFGLPELIASAVVVGLQAWKHNLILSIVPGTLIYMALLQYVFV